MGILDLFGKSVRVPRFQVGVFGKLPCHKEYFRAAIGPVFTDLSDWVDRSFDQLIRSGAKRPYVFPNRRIFLAMPQHKQDLVACLFESDDGRRGFPFLMAAPIPQKFRDKPFPVFFQVLEQVWAYLEAYFVDLRGQPDSTAVYNRVRGIVHDLPSLTPQSWELCDPLHILPDVNGLFQINGSVDVIRSAPRRTPHKTKPAFILWPGLNWTEKSDDTKAWLGQRGLADLDITMFHQPAPHGLFEDDPDDSTYTPTAPLPIPLPVAPTEEEAESPQPVAEQDPEEEDTERLTPDDEEDTERLEREENEGGDQISQDPPEEDDLDDTINTEELTVVSPDAEVPTEEEDAEDPDMEDTLKTEELTIIPPDAETPSEDTGQATERLEYINLDPKETPDA